MLTEGKMVIQINDDDDAGLHALDCNKLNN